MKRTWASIFALLALVHAGRLVAQPVRELRGQVYHRGENGEKIFEPGVIVTLVATGATDDTNDQGIFRLPLPPSIQSEGTVTLSIDKPGWRIRYPLDGEAQIPRNLLSEIVPVELLPAGSKAFWTHDRIEKFIQDASERSKQEGRRERDAPVLDLGRDIKEWAAKYGFSAQETREEIDRWIVEVEAAHENNYQKGLAAFAKQQFDAAAERFRDSAEWRMRQLEETRKQEERLAEKSARLQQEVVRDLRLQGDSYMYVDRFQEALTVYDKALQFISKDQAPQLWAATLNDIGRAHEELGRRVKAAESPAHFVAAVKASQQALLVCTRELFPQEWARIQNSLGFTLLEQGRRTTTEEGTQLFAQAVEAFQQALLVRTREQLPQDWAQTWNNLGLVFQEQGMRVAGEGGAHLLAQAAEASRQALLVYSRDQVPQGYAAAQTNLGNTLTEQGRRTSGKEGIQLLVEAVQAHGQALLVYTREQLPQRWAMAHYNLGNALAEQGRRTPGEEGARLLEQAAQSYRQALLVYDREQWPQKWAWAQTALGIVLREQGTHTSGEERARLFAQAVDALRQALLVQTREHLPLDWAGTQNNLGEALRDQGRSAPREEGAQLLAQALDAYQKALLVFTPDGSSEWWAITRSNEAEALLALHRNEEAAGALSEVFARVPDYRRAFDLLGTTLNDRLFHPKEAVALARSWLSRHPDDLLARLSLGEQLFASRAFSGCGQEVASLLKERELDAKGRVAALGHAIATRLAMDSPDAFDPIEELLGVVAAQPQDFSSSRTFEGALHALGEAPEVPHKDLLVRLFRALAAPDRDSLLKGLREWKEAAGAESRN